ncbi:MAG: nitrous oxide reductase accessory protein NosL [Syntrophobacteraceae bacterium]
MGKRSTWSTFVLILTLALASVCFAQKAPDVQQHPSCKYCGMDREQFAHSRFLIDYDDGTSFAACSIHCAAVDLAMNIDKTPKSMQVGDYATKKLIDAEGATWVLGGSKPGVMTKRAKWAFGKKEDAEQFVKENGGEVVTFDRAMQATYEDMYGDTKMIRDKRKAKKAGSQASGDPHQHGQPGHQHKHEDQPKKP